MRLKPKKRTSISDEALLSGPRCNCTFGTKTQPSRSIRGAQRARARERATRANEMKKESEEEPGKQKGKSC